MAPGRRPFQRHSHDVPVADERELDRFPDVSRERLVDPFWTERARVGAVDQQNFVADADTGPSRSQILGNFADVEPLVGTLPEHGADGAPLRSAGEQRENAEQRERKAAVARRRPGSAPGGHDR